VVADSARWNDRVERRLRHLQRRLELSPAEAEAFAHAHRASAAAVRGLGQRLHEARFALRRVMVEERGDPERIRAAVRRMTAAQARFDSSVAEALLRELGALPEAQRIRYLETLPWQRWGAGDPARHEQGGHRGRGRGHGTRDGGAGGGR
jgi:hypothetical protein